MHCERDVGRERPWRRRPHEEKFTGAIFYWKFYKHRLVLEISVTAVRQFMLRQRRPAASTPRHHRMPLEQPSALAHLFQKMPNVLVVLLGHGVVGIFPIHPLPQPTRLLSLNACVFQHTIATGAGKFVQSICNDILLRVEPQAFFHLDFHPEALTIKPVLKSLVRSAHRPIALKHVFVRATPAMVHAHGIVGRDRPVDK